MPSERAVAGEAGPAPDIAPVTNAEGKFSMDGLPWGTWRFHAIDPQGRRGTAEVHIWGYKTAKVTIKLNKTALKLLA